ncbi:MAG: ACP S-malonyltransferase [Lachnospiraceae bacterium]|jgi:[acyl-carrier-protein] S-malonyltransferase|nr:ACP S-malonyltransferase [Lachnospiraceae bacterium]
MGKIAYLFPGQGAQKPGMGKDFYENSEISRRIFDKAGGLLGLDMKTLCFEENEDLNRTEFTQAAMVTASLAMVAEIDRRREAGTPIRRPDVTAGLSLGEYCAMAAAGAMETMDAITLVRKRGIFMEEAVPAGEGAMAAVLAMKAEDVSKVLASIPGVWIANYNCPGQIVISGQREAVADAGMALRAAGARRVLPLNVSGPFHSPLLKEAGDKLAEQLVPVKLSAPRIPYVTNVTAGYVRDVELMKGYLRDQVSSPVKWQQSVEAMAADGVDTFVEIGPGKTLTSFVKKIVKEAVLINVETWEDLGKLEEGGLS